MSESDDPTLSEVKREHYEKMAPLVKKARDAVADALESDNDQVRFKAAQYVLGESEQWLKKASGERVEEIPPEEQETFDEQLADMAGPDTTKTVKTLSPDVAEDLN